MRAISTRCFLLVLQHTKEMFVEEAKTDVTLALKNVMIKFAEKFSEYIQENEDEIEEGGVFCFSNEIFMQPGKLVAWSKKYNLKFIHTEQKHMRKRKFSLMFGLVCTRRRRRR